MGGRKGSQGLTDRIPKLILPVLRVFLETERQKQNLAHISMSEPLTCSSFHVIHALNSSVAPNAQFWSPRPWTRHIRCFKIPCLPSNSFSSHTLSCLFCSCNEERLQNASSHHPNYEGMKFCLRTTFLFQNLTRKKLEHFTLF